MRACDRLCARARVCVCVCVCACVHVGRVRSRVGVRACVGLRACVGVRACMRISNVFNIIVATILRICQITRSN